MPSLAEKIDLLENSFKEVAFGYNDSGCFWSLQYGPRGAGSMMDGFGCRLDALEAETFEEAVDHFIKELGLTMPEQSANAGPGSPLTDAELDSAAHMWIESGHISVVRSKLIAEIRRLRAQVAELSDQKQRAACYILDYVPRSVALAAVQEALAHGRREGVAPLAWTKEPPTVPGSYWHRFAAPKGWPDKDVVKVLRDGGLYVPIVVDGELLKRPVDDIGGEWSGPIQPPA